VVNGVAFRVCGVGVQSTWIVTMVVAFVLLIVLDTVVNKTKLGKGIRAVAQDAETASLMGVHIDRTISLTFVLGGLMGGVAGFLFGLQFGVIYTMGFVPGLKAFTAATGIQEIPRKAGDPKWFEFLQFQREAYRGYLRHYITEVKRTNPDLQLCSHWAFSGISRPRSFSTARA